MPRVNYEISVPYQADLVFDLVADIESYPNFLPWCTAARILREENNVIYAELAIRYKFFFSKYTSKVILNPKNEIKVELVSGPFQYLINTWKFIQNADNSTIIFSLDFKLKSALLDNILENEINKYSSIMFESFIKRAKFIYG